LLILHRFGSTMPEENNLDSQTHCHDK